MAKYLSEVYSGKRNIPQPDSAEICAVPVDVVFGATALVANDIIMLTDVPEGVSVADYSISAPQLDSHGAPTLAFSLGDANAAGDDLTTVYETGLIPGHTASGSVVRCGNALASSAATTSVRNLALKVTTAAATAATSGKTLTVLLKLRG